MSKTKTYCEHVFVLGPTASPLARLRRALERGSLLQAEAAARELGRIDDEDALALLLLLRREGDARYERAALRWLGRFLAGHPGIGFELAGDLLDGLAELDGPNSDVARSRVALAVRAAGLERAADHVARAHDLQARS